MNKKLLRKKLALMLANLKKKRPFYTEVEYLESTGTQLVNTGISFVSQDDYVIKTRSVNFDTSKRAIIISNYIAYNQYSALSLEWWAGSSSYNGKARAYCITKSGSSSGTNTTSDAALSINVPHDLELNYSRTNNSISLKWDGNTATDTLNAATLPNYSGSFCLFLDERPSLPDTIKNPTRIYYLQIYHNGVLVRDFIPVLDWDMTPCMYDKVTEQLFYNQGTGDFTAGREIHPVEYLYTGDDINCMSSSPFTSTSYRLIDTKETIDLTSVVEIKFAFDKNIYYSGCGLRNNSSNMTQSVYFPACYGTQDKFGWTIGSGEEQRQKFTLDTNDHTIRVDLPNSKVVWDDVNYPIANLTYTPSERTFPLFAFSDVRATQDNGYRFPMQGKIYYAKFWKNGVPTKDFIPAIDENGVGYMFDRVTHTIYDNAGTGAFSYPAREVEYLESTGTQYIDTGLDYFADFEVGIQLRTSVSNKALGNGTFYCMQRYNIANPYWYFTKGSGLSNSYASSTPITEHHVMKWKDNKIYSDDVLLTEFTKDLNTPNRMCLFGVSSSNKYPNVIYFCKLWNPTDGTLVRDFIPSYKDGVLGMWDKANNVFYPNAGTGTFTTGKIVEPEYE